MARLCLCTVKNCTSEPVTIQQATKARTSFKALDRLFKTSPPIIVAHVQPSATFQIEHTEANSSAHSVGRSAYRRSKRGSSDVILLGMSNGTVSSISTTCCLGNYAAKSSYVIEVDDLYVLDVVQERIKGQDVQDYSVSVTVNPVRKALGSLSIRAVDEVIRSYLAVHYNPREDEGLDQSKSIGIHQRRGSIQYFFRDMLARKRKGPRSSITSSCSGEQLSRTPSFGWGTVEPL
eukprot:3534363-Pyramimonas_sp.AAC.1